jgi:hypothetical protein
MRVLATSENEREPNEERHVFVDVQGVGLGSGRTNRVVLYSDLIYAALSEAARKALQMIPQGYQYKTPYIRDAIEQGRTEGRAEGQARSVLEVFEARQIIVSEEQRSRILACTDLAQLSQWHKRALRVTSVEELFTQ